MKLDDFLQKDVSTDDIVSDAMILAYLSMVNEGKTSKSPVDFGDGFYAKRVGFDTNGNWSYWVTRGANRFRKIQALNVNAGANKITDMSNFNDPDYADTVNGIKEYYMKYIASNRLGESIENSVNFDINFNNSELISIPDTLSYRVKNAVLETDKGPVNISDAGVISLGMDELDLIQRLVEQTGESITKVNNIVIKQPPSDIQFSGPLAVSGAYTVLVTYTTPEGSEKQTEVNFNDLDFAESDSLLGFLHNLT